MIKRLLVLLLLAAAAAAHADSVILLHGIARSPSSLGTLEETLKAHHYRVLNLDYPSQQKNLDDIAATLHPTISKFASQEPGKVHFITHSMGGLVTRNYLAKYPLSNLGNVVMLAPPNQGSEVANTLAPNLLYQKFYGPAGQQLTTSATTALPAPTYPLGIIAGNKSFFLFASWLVLPGPDDGRVTVSRTHVAGETAHLTLPTTHTFIMNNPTVISQTLTFLKTGHFSCTEQTPCAKPTPATQ